MKTIAWINNVNNIVVDVVQYGEGISVSESSTSFPIEVTESDIPVIGSRYDAETGAFYPPTQP